jgi:hypothetical protein
MPRPQTSNIVHHDHPRSSRILTRRPCSSVRDCLAQSAKMEVKFTLGVFLMNAVPRTRGGGTEPIPNTQLTMITTRRKPGEHKGEHKPEHPVNTPSGVHPNSLLVRESVLAPDSPGFDPVSESFLSLRGFTTRLRPSTISSLFQLWSQYSQSPKSVPNYYKTNHLRRFRGFCTRLSSDFDLSMFRLFDFSHNHQIGKIAKDPP